MKMGLRWFGEKYDTVPLEYIRQIAGVKGVITTLYNTQAGDEWEKDEILALKNNVESHDLKVLGIESVNIHDDIKIGLPTRDMYIERYINTIKKLSDCGIDMICYNFMPIFDWTRTDLAKPRKDGSTVLAYDQKVVDKITPENMFNQIKENSNGHTMPGWEPERLVRIKELFELYKDVDEEKLWGNLKYFIDAIMPTCEKYGVKMAIHPDDPGWSVFGLPRIITSKKALLKLTNEVHKSEYNGVTFCAGSLGTKRDADLPDIIRTIGKRIHFAHVRNMDHTGVGTFEESAHLSSDGSFDMYEIVKALHDIDFDGIVRPDHGRCIWGESSMPGYGLYDRALGAQYILGLNEAIIKGGK